MRGMRIEITRKLATQHTDDLGLARHVGRLVYPGESSADHLQPLSRAADREHDNGRRDYAVGARV